MAALTTCRTPVRDPRYVLRDFAKTLSRRVLVARGHLKSGDTALALGARDVSI